MPHLRLGLPRRFDRPGRQQPRDLPNNEFWLVRIQLSTPAIRQPIKEHRKAMEVVEGDHAARGIMAKWRAALTPYQANHSVSGYTFA